MLWPETISWLEKQSRSRFSNGAPLRSELSVAYIYSSQYMQCVACACCMQLGMYLALPAVNIPQPAVLFPILVANRMRTITVTSYKTRAADWCLFFKLRCLCCGHFLLVPRYDAAVPSATCMPSTPLYTCT